MQSETKPDGYPGNFPRIRKHVHKCLFTDTSLSITERGYTGYLKVNKVSLPGSVDNWKQAWTMQGYAAQGRSYIEKNRLARTRYITLHLEEHLLLRSQMEQVAHLIQRLVQSEQLK